MSQSVLTDYISALLASGTPHWGSNGTVLDGSAVGGAVTVTYAFLTSSRQVSSADSSGFATMSTAQRAAVRQALAAWSAVANITFVETTDVSGATIAFGTNRQYGQSAAYAYYPSTASQGGQVFLANDSAANSSPTLGSYGYLTLVHEIGHALGLKHPGNYNAGLQRRDGRALSPDGDRQLRLQHHVVRRQRRPALRQLPDRPQPLRHRGDPVSLRRQHRHRGPATPATR